MMRVPGWLVRMVLVVGGVCVVLTGIILAGKSARDYLDRNQRREIPFREITCLAPRGYDPIAFRDEVRIHAQLPEMLTLPDATLEPMLRNAFAAHPAVAEVMNIDIHPQRGILVELQFRDPVLLVQLGDRAKPRYYLLDEQGRYRHVAAASALLRFIAPLPPPPGEDGTIWPDPTIQSATQIAALVADCPVPLAELELAPGGWRLIGESGQPVILWGRSPGHEPMGEPSAAEKIRYLYERLRDVKSTRMREIDLRHTH